MTDSISVRRPRQLAAPRWAPRIGWAAWYVLRLWLAAFLLVYGWAKVYLVQMGMPDVADALVTHGEMSPMGLLWRFMAFSPTVQVVAGAAEVAAGALLLWRRTAAVGALLGAVDMWIVFGLNVFFDVDVKQLSLALALGCTIAFWPYAARWARAALGNGVVPAGPRPEVFGGRAGRVLAVLGVVVALAMPLGSGLLAGSFAHFGRHPHVTNALVGVHRVVSDTAAPAPQLAADTRWQQVAFGEWGGRSGRAAVSLRQANGDLRTGSYEVAGDRVTLRLKAPLRGPQPLTAPVTDEWQLTFAPLPDGRVRLVGAGQDLVIAPDAEGRFLFDRDFSWTPRMPVNR